MRRYHLLIFLIAWPLLASAQRSPSTLDDLAKSAEQWAKENLDTEALNLLPGADQEKVKKLLADLEKQFRAKYVLDLAALKDATKSIIPILESYEETAPYALWLRTQLDYLDVAEQLSLSVPTPKQPPGHSPAQLPYPKPQLVRDIWITRVADRPPPALGKTYVPTLKPIFTAQKIPGELIWVAEVESSFDPRARSPAGAAGLFQLMPATARRYGLSTWPFDQRLKPEPSAKAAAQYLQFLHSHYKDWRLALAAYNCGEGTVDKVLTRYKAKTYDAIAQYLPAETQLFVPRVEATIQRREGVRLAEL
jgi:membrane-bound lytic murein transglycosylase D